MDLACCHGNRYDVISALEVFPINRVAKIFIVGLYCEISFQLFTRIPTAHEMHVARSCHVRHRARALRKKDKQVKG